MLPILAKRIANGTNLAMLIVPESLFEINKGDLAKTARELFGQDIFIFDFNQDTPLTKTELLKIQAGLLQTIQERGFIATTKSNLLAYQHAYHKLSIQIGKEQNEEARETMAENLKIMAKTLKLIKDKGDVIADEVDTILDVRKEVNFAIGNPEELNKVTKTCATKLMEMILQHSPTLKKALKTDDQVSLGSEGRGIELKKVAVEYLKELKQQNKGVDFGADDDFITFVTTQDSKVTLDAGSWPPFLRKLKAENLPLFNEVATMRQLLSVGLVNSLALSKTTPSGYGRDPNGIWTIPYSNSAPSLKSQFDNEIERTCNTLQDYIANGISDGQARELVNGYLQAARQELMIRRDREPDLTLDETEVGKEFTAYIQDINKNLPKDRQLPLSLKGFKYDQIRDLKNAIAEIPEAAVAYCNHFVLAKMQFSPLQITGTPQDLVAMTHSFRGFTGTLWNDKTFADKIDAKKTAGVDGKTYTLLMEMKPKVRKITLEPGNEIGSLLSQTGLVGEYQALIELGGVLKGKRSDDRSHKSMLKLLKIQS